MSRMMISLTPSIVALLAANTVPVFGVLWLGWELFPLVFVYWLENGVIGGFALLKMLTTFTDLPEGKSQACSWYRDGSRLRFNKSFLLLVLFFLIPYGGFCLGHGAFIVMMFGEKAHSLTQTYQIIVQNGLQYTVLALILSHGFSFFRNYIGRGEYKNCDPGEFFCSPYRRVVVLHVFILLGGFVIESVGVSRTGLLLLITVKIVADIVGHVYERSRRWN